VALAASADGRERQSGAFVGSDAQMLLDSALGDARDGSAAALGLAPEQHG